MEMKTQDPNSNEGAAVLATRPTRNVNSSRRDIGAFLGGAALATAALPAHADVQVDASKVRSTKGGVKYVVVKEGKCPLIDPSGALGSCYPAPESYVTIDFTGFLPNGQVFDSTEKKGGKPLSFRAGERQVVPGIEQVVAQMKPGEEVQALLPAKLAYGDKGVCTDDGECLIKPGTDLKYFIRLIRVAAAAG
jgi:FKBP-type peptidyl-prolyl cis-trans isomerase